MGGRGGRERVDRRDPRGTRALRRPAPVANRHARGHVDEALAGAQLRRRGVTRRRRAVRRRGRRHGRGVGERAPARARRARVRGLSRRRRPAQRRDLAARPFAPTRGPALLVGLPVSVRGRSAIAVRRTLFDAVGGMDEELYAFEDVDFCWKVQQDLGVPLTYVPEAVVYYRYRTSLRGVFRQRVRTAPAWSTSTAGTDRAGFRYRRTSGRPASGRGPGGSRR